MIEIERVHHVGIRVMDVARALPFYTLLGFGDPYTVPEDDVTIVRNAHGVEINLITNGSDDNDGKNILMDVAERYPGYTHVALQVTSVVAAMAYLKEHGIALTGGPIDFGDGRLSIFVRDPDRNVIELRGRDREPIPPDQFGPQ